VKLSLDWNLYPNWILGLGAEYSDIDTTGAQHQQFYAGPFVGTTYDADDKISSSCFSTIVKISYAF
jgi:hypothetical protein